MGTVLRGCPSASEGIAVDWLTVYYLWEAQRIAPRGLASMEGIHLLETPHGRLQYAAQCAGYDVQADNELRSRFAAAGIEQVDVYAVVQDAEDSTGQGGDVRCRRKGQSLTVNLLVHDDASVGEEAFQEWMAGRLRAALVPWLDKRRTKVA
jgi:hypothetical protein